MADGECIEPEDMGLSTDNSSPELQLSVVAMSNRPSGQVNSGPDMASADGELSLEDYFMRFVLEHQDSMSETELAQKLGISRKCLWERRQRFDLPRSQTGKRRRS